MREWLFPLLLVLLDLGAAGMYALDGDWRRGVYWYRHDVTAEGVRALRVTGLSFNEIARRLRTSWPTVRSRVMTG